MGNSVANHLVTSTVTASGLLSSLLFEQEPSFVQWLSMVYSVQNSLMWGREPFYSQIRILRVQPYEVAQEYRCIQRLDSIKRVLINPNSRRKSSITMQFPCMRLQKRGNVAAAQLCETVFFSETECS